MKQYEEFPKPAGSYTVGRTQMDFNYIAKDNSQRQLTAFFFYPSDSSEGKPTAQYAFPELPTLREELLKKLGNTADEQLFVSIRTWCYEDLKLSDKEKQYPVLLYSHGASSIPQQGTVICSELASAGYIVVSVGHPGGGMFKLRDGRLVNMTRDFMDSTVDYGMEAVTLITPQLVFEKLDMPEAVEISRKLTSAPEAVKFSRFADLQSEDIGYVADCLERINSGETDSIFKSRLQLDIGMGAFGHSLGGTTAAIVCRDDKRFVCGVNYDGNMLGALDSDLGKPFMQLCTVLAYNTNAFLLETNSTETYFFIIDNAHHYDFSDTLFTIRNEMFKGTREPEEMRHIIMEYTKTFFDRYLLKKQADIESIKYEGIQMIKKP